MKRLYAGGAAAAGLKGGVLKERERTRAGVYGFALFPGDLLGAEKALVKVLFKECGICSHAFQDIAGGTAFKPQDTKHYMVCGDVVPARSEGLVAAHFQGSEKIVGKA